MRLEVLALMGAALLSACGASPAGDEPSSTGADAREGLRVATFNVSFYRGEEGAMRRDLEAGTDPQMAAVTAIIERVSPDILVLNEFDYEEDQEAVRLFAERLGYAHALSLPSNTGVPSGRDLDKDGRADHERGSREYGGDAFGYGIYPGQYGIAVLSRLPIEETAVRSWRELLWRDLPGAVLPEGYYDEGDLEVLRLSSKTHAVVPVTTEAGPLNLVLAHPTPPGFDGPENRNGLRNAGEIALIEALVDPALGSGIADDEGRAGGLGEGAMFVIAGDLNADPAAGDGAEGAIASLLGNPLVTDPRPGSRGAAEAAREQGGANARQDGDAALDTADFSDEGVGNLRVDYVLPSSNLEVLDAGVFWPAKDEAGYDLVGPGWPVVSSDHRLVFVDLALPNGDEEAAGN